MAAAILLLAAIPEGAVTAQSRDRKAKKGKKAQTEAPVKAPPRTFRVDGGVKTDTTYPDSVKVASDSLPGRQMRERPGTDGPGGAVSMATDSLDGAPEIATGAMDGTPETGTDSLGSIVYPGITDYEEVIVGTDAAPASGGWSRADSLQAESYGITMEELALLREIEAQDSLAVSSGDGMSFDSDVFLSRREARELARAERLADTTRINRIFRDTIPISRLTLYSMVLPGFGQLYNSQAWKIPILYGLVGTSTYFWMKERKSYADYRAEYDYLMARKSSGDFTVETDHVRRKMMKHNTAKQLWMAGAIGSYLYFVGDAAINYPGSVNSVKKATTLSTIFPGAGQVYNKSYWKVPIVIGGIATFAMVIDWNNRGYKRYKDAYSFATDGDPNTSNDLSERYMNDPGFLKNMKNDFRRSRDLSIILAGLFYVFNIIDAHVDAHLKSYDISDDLGGGVSVNIIPTTSTVSTYSMGSTQTVGLGLQITF